MRFQSHFPQISPKIRQLNTDSGQKYFQKYRNEGQTDCLLAHRRVVAGTGADRPPPRALVEAKKISKLPGALCLRNQPLQLHDELHLQHLTDGSGFRFGVYGAGVGVLGVGFGAWLGVHLVDLFHAIGMILCSEGTEVSQE